MSADFGEFDTSNITEGSNLYYTNARADARIALQVGANLDLSSKDTDALTEGSTNLYYTTLVQSAAATGANLDLTNQDTGDLTEVLTSTIPTLVLMLVLHWLAAKLDLHPVTVTFGGNLYTCILC